MLRKLIGLAVVLVLLTMFGASVASAGSCGEWHYEFAGYAEEGWSAGITGWMHIEMWPGHLVQVEGVTVWMEHGTHGAGYYYSYFNSYPCPAVGNFTSYEYATNEGGSMTVEHGEFANVSGGLPGVMDAEAGFWNAVTVETHQSGFTHFSWAFQ